MYRRLLFSCLTAGTVWSEPAAVRSGGTPKRTPLASEQDLTVKFENRGTNAAPIDRTLFKPYSHATIEPVWKDWHSPDFYTGGSKGALWWEWRSPVTGWYAIDRPDEPDGPSDEYPWPYAFRIGPNETLEKETDEAAWSWERAVWFWAPKDSRHAICVVASPGGGRWRLQRLPTTLLPPEEQVTVLSPAVDAVASWRLKPARIGVDTERNADRIDLSPGDRWAFRESPVPEERPPVFRATMEWEWRAERSGDYVVESPPDGNLEVEAEWVSWDGTGVIFRAVKGATIGFTASLKLTQFTGLIHVREYAAPSHTSPEKAAELRGDSGREDVVHPGALGRPEDRVGSYHFERFPLWWKFTAPAEGFFQLTRTATDNFGVTDLRDERIDMRGSVAVCFPSPDKVTSVVDKSDSKLHSFRHSWRLQPGEVIWIRACGTRIEFGWKWATQ